MRCPCSEMCVEIGDYFYENGKYDEALCWYYDGIFETEAVISVYTKGTEYLGKLADCYRKTGDIENAALYEKQAEDWEVPEIV